MNWLLKLKNNGLKWSSEQLYLSSFALYLASVTIQTTTFSTYYPHRVGTIIQLFTLLVMVSKLVFLDELTLPQILVDLGLLSLGTIVLLTSGMHAIIVTVVLVLAARQVDFNKIIKVYMIVVGSLLLLAFLAAEVGLIKNITFETSNGLRQSFGVMYTTDFAAHIFYLCCAYLYLRVRTFRLVDLIPVLLGTWVVYRYTKTMTDLMALVLLIGLFLLYVYRRQLKRFWVCSAVLRYSFLAMPIFSLIILHLSATFNFHEPSYRKLNDLFSNRLALGNNAILSYGFKLFGQSPVNINGWGGDRVNTFKNGLGNLTYFFIDSSYLNLMISYGLLFAAVVIFGTSWFLYCRIKQQDYLLPTILAAIALASAFDQHLLEVTYNVFILAYFAKLPLYRTALLPRFEAKAWLSADKVAIGKKG